jgi:hypothetical protein
MAVVMLNSGVVHHVGVSRLHVRLARVLAEHGIPSLRFDLSGVGDSSGRSTSATLEELVLEDIASALECARSEGGVGDIVLMGVCSGATDSLDAAGRLDHVRGIICVDLIADLRTWQHYAVHYGRRLSRRESWVNTVTGRNRLIPRAISALRSRRGPQEHPQAMPSVRPVIARPQLAQDLERFLGRGGHALLVFSGGLQRYNHESQFRGALPSVARHPNLALAYHGDADHTFSDPRRQSELIRGVVDWLSS